MDDIIAIKHLSNYIINNENIINKLNFKTFYCKNIIYNYIVEFINNNSDDFKSILSEINKNILAINENIIKDIIDSLIANNNGMIEYLNDRKKEMDVIPPGINNKKDFINDYVSEIQTKAYNDSQKIKVFYDLVVNSDNIYGDKYQNFDKFKLYYDSSIIDNDQQKNISEFEEFCCIFSHYPIEKIYDNSYYNEINNNYTIINYMFDIYYDYLSNKYISMEKYTSIIIFFLKIYILDYIFNRKISKKFNADDFANAKLIDKLSVELCQNCKSSKIINIFKYIKKEQFYDNIIQLLSKKNDNNDIIVYEIENFLTNINDDFYEIYKKHAEYAFTIDNDFHVKSKYPVNIRKFNIIMGLIICKKCYKSGNTNYKFYPHYFSSCDFNITMNKLHDKLITYTNNEDIIKLAYIIFTRSSIDFPSIIHNIYGNEKDIDKLIHDFDINNITISGHDNFNDNIFKDFKELFPACAEKIEQKEEENRIYEEKEKKRKEEEAKKLVQQNREDEEKVNRKDEEKVNREDEEKVKKTTEPESSSSNKTMIAIIIIIIIILGYGYLHLKSKKKKK